MDESSPGAAPAQPDPPSEAERPHGLTLESCYRHPHEITGVHCTRCGRPICPDCMTEAPVGYQCPECVREARRTSPRRRVRARLLVGRPGIATTSLISVLAGVFVLEVAVGASRALGFGVDARKMFDLGAMVPAAIAHGQYWRFFTAMFLHFGLLHLALNCYALYLFGYHVESALGRGRFLLVYFGSGLLASVASYVFGPVVAISAGASGAVFGLLGAWVAYNFRRRGTALGAANLQGALFLIVLNLVLGFSGLLPVDNSAHVGGLVSGAAITALLEGIGPRGLRATLRVGGLVAMGAAGVALALWRTTALLAG